MSDSIFKKNTIDMIILKVKQDPTGRMAQTMQEIMDICEKQATGVLRWKNFQL